MTRIALVILLIPACSLPVSGTIEALSDRVESHCGWYATAGYDVEPQPKCHVFVETDATGGLLGGTVDPCDVPPAQELRVEPGWPHSEWARFAASPTVLVEPCGN